MFYEPAKRNHGLPHDPFKALVVPRPIGWVSSRSAEGIDNLAPYSYYNAVSSTPPQIAFASEGRKDSLANIEATGAFTLNVVSLAQFAGMNASSAIVPPDVDEFGLAGLSKVSGQMVNVSRVGEALAALECRHVQTIPMQALNGQPTGSFLIIGEVVGIFIDERVIDTRGQVDMAVLQPLSRLGYNEYAVVTSSFTANRPT